MKSIQTCIIISAILLFQATTADQTDSKAVDGTDSTFQVAKSPDGEAYFPKIKESCHEEYFRAAKLPSMQFKREEKSKLRFRLAIIPSFSKPLFLTYSGADKGATIEIKRLNLREVKNSTQPGDVELTCEVVVGDRIARILKDQVVEPKVRRPLGDVTELQRQAYEGYDGVTYILEVSTDTDYTMEVLWSPESIGNMDPEILKKFNLPKVDTKPFIEFRDYLLEITDMRVPDYPVIDLLDNG